MYIQSALASKKFLALLGCLHENPIKRKDLLSIAVNQLKISQAQAEGLVARNIHKLKKTNGLITASGKQGERAYHLEAPLLELISKHKNRENKLNYQERLVQERSFALTEMQVLRGEIQAYQDIQSAYPNCRKELTILIEEATMNANRLNGRLKALEKVIKLPDS
jgi:hypothetical protein